MKIGKTDHLPLPDKVWDEYEANKIPELVAIEKQQRLEKKLAYIGKQDARRAKQCRKKKV